jgi:hypothetical protein
MEDYIIEEIIDIDINEDYTSIKFKLEIDCIDEYRILETTDYYDWCIEDHQTPNDYSDIDYEENGVEFNIDNWGETYKNSEYVVDFIYENYDKLSDLPEIFTE